LFNEGTHMLLGEHLGAHPQEADGVAGTVFGAWAPNARHVSVVGDFNGWDVERHPLHPRASSGIWEGFVAGIGAGEIYKFALDTPAGRFMKADPFARFAEQSPRTGSIVWSLDRDW